MSTETKRKAIEAWMTAYNRYGASIAVDALEALMREVADERIAAHLPSKRVAVSDPSHPGETKPEPAKCAECGAYGLGSDLQNYGHTVGCSKHPEYGSKATPPSAKGPPETWDGPNYPEHVWIAQNGRATQDHRHGDPGYTRDDLVAAKVAEAIQFAQQRLTTLRSILGSENMSETEADAARRVVARVAELETACEELREAQNELADARIEIRSRETELAEVRAKLSDAHQVIEAARKKLWEVKP